ncbi:hypothetical protein EIN_176910 [Entamoeba invadens IP1]|uniref:hypothetical protein n=1 Tax=Entamoeba invadens IP1 TaxID=370355 RepID=UPI0002C3D045|nr:hypothetical protein EIN_176910 [Entamoeba invadens IP1]ELP93864.1 hypothetical protein EIN_176910 [Entamoeba invadens IP1]|eukprot:XP_004260635.1 hypothetical protein EIN_176910 [Entamoeba invadens IP1]
MVSCMLLTSLLLITVVNSQEELNICLVKNKAFETEGQIPTNMFHANNGIIVEINKTTEWCYYFHSTKSRSSSKCFPNRYVWNGIDNAATMGVRQVPEETYLDELKQNIDVQIFRDNETLSESYPANLIYVLMNDTGPDKVKTKFSNVGRDMRLVQSKKGEFGLMIAITVDYAKGLTGSVIFGLVRIESSSIYMKYDYNDTSYLQTISPTNLIRLEAYEDTFVAGSPQARDGNIFDFSKNVYVQKLIDIDRPTLPLSVSPPIFIPPSKNNLFDLGQAVEISKDFILFSDPSSEKGVVFAFSRKDDALNFSVVMQPFPRWGNFQSFGEFLAVTSDEQNPHIYVAAPNAWIHDNVRKAVKLGRSTTEYIGVIYEFQVNDKTKIVESKNYFFVKSDKQSGGLLNSTISNMKKSGDNVYVTLANYDGVFLITCEENLTLFL